jgi:hypothetical protein
MKGILSSVVAVVAVLATASACTSSHSTTGTVHAQAAQKPAALGIAVKVHKVLVDQGSQMPPVQTAAHFCLAGILKDERDTIVGAAIGTVDPGAGDAWTSFSLAGDEDDTVTLYQQDGVFAGTFQLGQFLYDLIAATGQKLTAGTPEEFEFQLFGIIGPAAIYCTEAALWLEGTVEGQLVTAVRKWFSNWQISQQQLASQGSAITGNWVLYRKLENCSVTGSNGCELDQMNVTIACTGSGCTIIRTNGAAGFQPWDHSILLTFSDGVWVANGPEQWAAQCDQEPVPGTTVALAVKVTSGQTVDGVWRAQGLAGSYTVNNVATSCFPAGTTVEEVSTTPFPGSTPTAATTATATASPVS